MAQLVTRLDDRLLADLDALVAEGAYGSRSEVVRHALEEMIDRHRRRRVGAAIVAGYECEPQREGEVGWADASTVRMIAEEPW